jgi:hypothetical protein
MIFVGITVVFGGEYETYLAGAGEIDELYIKLVCGTILT